MIHSRDDLPAPALRVLVVDDNPDAAATLGMLIRVEGHNVQTANDGYAALEAVRKLNIDVVLCDIGMPGMNGYAVARTIRADPSLARVYLVALTGFSTEETISSSREAGFDRHLVKPVDPAEIVELLRNFGRK